jgi:hypothetical protein
VRQIFCRSERRLLLFKTQLGYNSLVKYFYLLTAGLLVSSVHFFLVWPNRHNGKRSLSEHAIFTKKSRLVYFITHVITEILFLKFSYQFFINEHSLYIPHYLNIGFAVLDFVQAAVPSRNRTEKIHWVAAYFSWLSYLSSGVIALFLLDVSQPYAVLAGLLLIPILGMFTYMHVNRSKLYPYQLSIVPLFVIYVLLVVLGSN